MKPNSPQLERFERLEGELKPSWVYPIRKAGIARFAEQGFPTLAHEDWRFTNVAPIVKLPFKPVVAPAQDGVSKEELSRFLFGKLPGHRLVFVNGIFVPSLSSGGGTTDGVVVSNLADALSKHRQLLEKHFGGGADRDGNAFSSLNTAFFQDGAFVYLPDQIILAEPVHVMFISTARETGTTTHPRNIFIAGANSGLTVLESYVSTVDATYVTNAVTEIVAGENASMEHVKFQDESLSAYHIASIHAHLGARSNVIAHSIATGARLSRNSIRTKLAGKGLECILNGLYLTKGEQLADHHMVVEHAEPNCNSHEYYNGILDGKSRGVFHGRILVKQIAQKTDAKQTNKNLLLSDDATVDTKPQLEIYADDVKCTHGATIGQLNEEAIFYLRSRGLSVETARSMLIHAFAGEIIERVRHSEVRAELDKLVWERLEANPHVGEQKG